MENKVGHVSATSIAAFKACPTRYRLGYVEALRLAVEPQPLRFGTAWHRGLEILSMPVGTLVQVDPSFEGAPPDPITEDNRLALAVELATSVYTTIPDGQDPTDWAVEREVLANALVAYHWLYNGDDAYETVATELEFDLPLVNPETGHATPNFRRVGKIDRIIRHKGTGRLLIQENKSTARPIDSGSTYWDRLRKDTQSKFYICAARDINLPGTEGKADGTSGTDVSGLLHDVFRKPAISPSKLTQAETATFIASGEYCGQKFSVSVAADGSVAVDEWMSEVFPGAEPKPKKDGTVTPRPFAIRETPAMFGARLLADMTGNTEALPDAKGPEHYFARREVAFTDAELLSFQHQVWALQRNMSEMERTGFYWENENQCEATGSFKCPYCPICYNNVACFDGTTTPSGFKRLRTQDAEQTEAAGAE
jgi:hypothetical protein